MDLTVLKLDWPGLVAPATKPVPETTNQPRERLIFPKPQKTTKLYVQRYPPTAYISYSESNKWLPQAHNGLSNRDRLKRTDLGRKETLVGQCGPKNLPFLGKLTSCRSGWTAVGRLEELRWTPMHQLTKQKKTHQSKSRTDWTSRTVGQLTESHRVDLSRPLKVSVQPTKCKLTQA